jgi:hypothetical protein
MRCVDEQYNRELRETKLELHDVNVTHNNQKEKWKKEKACVREQARKKREEDKQVLATMVAVFHKQEDTWKKETAAVMQRAKTKREQDKQVWQKEKAAVLLRAKTQREEDKNSFDKTVKCNKKMRQALLTEETEKRSLAQELILVKEGRREIAEENADLQKDIQKLEEAKVLVDAQLQGAKEAFEIGDDDCRQLAYELRQSKSAHNLDSWRLGKLEAHNEQLKKQLTEALALPSLLFLNMLFVFSRVTFIFPVLEKNHSGKNK